MSKTLSQAITDLASATTPLAGTEYLLVVQSGTAKKCESEDVGGGGASYLKYVAMLTQTGTDAPTATVLENTLGGTVVWSYSDAGVYIATLSGVFTESKTYCIAGNNTSGFLIFGKSVELPGENSLLLQTNASDGTPANDSLYQTAIEIRVYP